MPTTSARHAMHAVPARIAQDSRPDASADDALGCHFGVGVGAQAAFSCSVIATASAAHACDLTP